MNAYTVSRKIHFQNSRQSKKTIRPGEKPKRKTARTPRISKLMALAIHFEQMLRDGHVEDMATLARYGQVTRARMTQIMNLLLLAPDIQETILNLPTGEHTLQLVFADFAHIAHNPPVVSKKITIKVEAKAKKK